MSFSHKLEKLFKQSLPAPFTIAVILTFITFSLALLITNSDNQSSNFINILTYWEKGIWNPDLLVFAMQMMLMLVLGHTLALTKPIHYLITKATLQCTNTPKAAAIVTFFTIIVSLFNWGLGLIFGAIFARKVGEHFSKEGKIINYPLIGAAGYSGLMVWHGGISGSAPIKIAEAGHFLENKIGVISQGETIFSLMNISVSLCLIIILPILMYWIGKINPGKIIKLKLKDESRTLKIEGAEHLDHSKILAYLFGGMIISISLYNFIFQSNYMSFSFLTPNYINLLLLGLTIIMHKSFYNFLNAVDKAISGASGILIQFPIYFGIMGIMNHSGMVDIMSEIFVSISNKTTLPVFTFISGAIVNIFVPSGGGQWVVQGPIIVEAAIKLGVEIPKNIMALAYGDQLTNMLQPFWALPLLGITKLKAREIIPYTLIIMCAGIIIFVSALMIF